VLPFSDHTYVQAPFEDCSEEVFEDMAKHLHAIDLKNVLEEEDATNHARDSVACSGGACNI
jgi:ribonucleoside-diphosphate reductase alpha chain